MACPHLPKTPPSFVHAHSASAGWDQRRTLLLSKVHDPRLIPAAVWGARTAKETAGQPARRGTRPDGTGGAAAALQRLLLHSSPDCSIAQKWSQ